MILLGQKENLKERIERINRELDDMLKDDRLPFPQRTSSEELMLKFGLSVTQAKAWLKKEPNFSSDVGYHEPKNRRKVNRIFFHKVF